MIDDIRRVIGAWQDVTLAAHARAAALLAVMTLAEKLKQLGSAWPGRTGFGEDFGPVPGLEVGRQSFEEVVQDGLGQLTRPFGTAVIEPREGARRLAAWQREVVAANRFGIPAIAHEECLTGFMAWRATVYPSPIAWAATFDPALVERMGAAIGRDMASVGVHQGLAPVLDVVRDYRWGRVEETLGEDPYLVGELGTAYIRGLQSDGIVATAKHFAGYSASRGARNHAPVAMGPRELADVILPPFERAVVDAKVRSVMNSYTEIDGIPAASDEALLTYVLRQGWKFEGTVVSDYWAIPFLSTAHHLAEDVSGAGAIALQAGIDVELPYTVSYGPELLARFSRGEADATVLDRAVLRVLTQKAELGLLDPDWSPEISDTDAVELDSAANRAIARQLAEESLVLLENHSGLLPLANATSLIAVVGPCADDVGCLFGCYSFPNHVVPNEPGRDIGISAPTVLDAIRGEFPGAIVTQALGVGIIDPDPSGIPEAVQLAQRADVTIVVVGDRSGMFGRGTSGEGCDATDLRLPGIQEQLVDALLGASERVVLVVLSGRPYAIGDLARRAAAAIQAFFPGEEGGGAIAGLMSGRVAPSGRLPVQIPTLVSTQPGTYLATPLALKRDSLSSIDPTPAYPFGFGRSYSDLSFGNVSIDSPTMTTAGTVVVRAEVRNGGSRPGWHVPQLYLSDPVASVTRPVKQLIGFQRVFLQPGESAIVEFRVDADVTAFTGRDMRRRIEPGRLVLTVAESAGDSGHPLEVHMIGEVRFVDHSRSRTTGTNIIRGGVRVLDQ